MPKRTFNQNELLIGGYNTECDECSFKFKNVDLKKDWRGFYLCHDCYQPRHPQDFLKGIPDSQDIPWSRPDTNDEGAGPSSVPNQAVPNNAIPNISDGYTNPL